MVEKTKICGDLDQYLSKYIRSIQICVSLLSCYNCRPAEKNDKIKNEVTSNYLQNCTLMIQIGDLIVKAKIVK